MRKEIKTYEVVCDCCETPLYDSGVRTNCGSASNGYEEPYLTNDDIDLCYTCAGKIFARDVVKKIPKEKMQEFIQSLKELEGNTRNIMLFKKDETNLSSQDEDNSPKLPKSVTFLSDL